MNYLNGHLAVFFIFTDPGKTILVLLTTHVLPLLTETNRS